MDSSHPLNLNLRKVINCLGDILQAPEAARIEAELHRNVRQALQLAEGHLRCARGLNGSLPAVWRQRVSRGYYCCYCASRALRLATTGAFSTEVEDHKRVGELPDTFPDRAIWANLLTKFRADRNLADYDHTVSARALEYSASAYVEHATRFLGAVKVHLHSQGVL